MEPFPLISHVDLRVRDRARAIAFYDALVPMLGGARHDDDAEGWVSYAQPRGNHWFGFIEEPGFTPNETRIAFNARDRAAVDAIRAKLPSIGARAIEGDDGEIGPAYYAVFFEDPDGNKLEVMAYRETAG